MICCFGQSKTKRNKYVPLPKQQIILRVSYAAPMLFAVLSRRQLFDMSCLIDDTFTDKSFRHAVSRRRHFHRRAVALSQRLQSKHCSRDRNYPAHLSTFGSLLSSLFTTFANIKVLK